MIYGVPLPPNEWNTCMNTQRDSSKLKILTSSASGTSDTKVRCKPLESPGQEQLGRPFSAIRVPPGFHVSLGALPVPLYQPSLTAQWYSACLVCTRCWVWSLVLKGNNDNNNLPLHNIPAILGLCI